MIDPIYDHVRNSILYVSFSLFFACETKKKTERIEILNEINLFFYFYRKLQLMKTFLIRRKYIFFEKIHLVIIQVRFVERKDILSLNKTDLYDHQVNFPHIFIVRR